MHMRLLTTVAVPPWQEAAVLEQLLALCREAGVSDVAVMVQVHPEDEPLLAKIDDAAARFARIQARLEQEGIHAGILLQTLLDHGERGYPISSASFQRIVGADGCVVDACFCPLDPAFRAYVAEAVTRLAATRPAFMLVEDDVRIGGHSPANRECCCPLHLAAYARHTGQAMTREKLLEQVAQDDDLGLTVRADWYAVQQAGVLDFVRIVRAAMDVVDPALRGGVCVCSNQLLHAEAMGRILAGPNRPLLRLGNAYYLEQGYKNFPGVMAGIAHQRARLPEDFEFLSEADTWPQTRYSLSVTGLRGYIICAALAGADLPEVWVTNLLEWEPHEGHAYRAMLRESRALFDAVHALGRQVRWDGPIALNDFRELYRKPWTPATSEWLPAPPWGGVVCGRLGLPFRTAGEGGVRMLAGNAPRGFTRDELLAFLAGGLLLDGDAARILAGMGLGEHLGVDVAPGDDLRPNFEQFSDDLALNGTAAARRLYIMRMNPSQLVHLRPHPGTDVASWLMRWPGFQSMEQQRLAPALTVCANALGGRVAVYAHSVPGFAEQNFLTDARKEQLRHLLAWLAGAPLPAATVDTADCYLQCGRLPDGARLLLVVNLNTDPIAPLRLRLPVPPANLHRLDDDGTWRPCDCASAEGIATVPVRLETMRPLLLRWTPVDTG